METFDMDPVQFFRFLMKIKTQNTRYVNMRSRGHNKVLLDLQLCRTNVYLEEPL